MAIGVTEAWQQRAQYQGGARPNARYPITCYDDFPPVGRSGKCSMTREQFVGDLRAYTGDEAYAYVLCDVPVRSVSSCRTEPRARSRAVCSRPIHSTVERWRGGSQR